jgi:hypothetical protein
MSLPCFKGLFKQQFFEGYRFYKKEKRELYNQLLDVRKWVYLI